MLAAPQLFLFFFQPPPGAPAYVLAPNLARVIGDGFNRNWTRPIQPGETDTLSVEFTDELSPGETIGEPDWTIAVQETAQGFAADTTPGQRLNLSPNVATLQDPMIGLRSFTNQSVTLMVAGNLYLLDATVVTSYGRVLAKSGLLWCRPPVGGA